MKFEKVTLTVSGEPISLVDFIKENVVEKQNITTDQLRDILELSPCSVDMTFIGRKVIKRVK